MGAGQRVAWGNGWPVFTGTGNGAADNAALLKMLSDNDNTYASQPKYGTRAGNLARQAIGITVADAA